MTADPLVLVPGLLCDARVFQPQITAISARRAVHVTPPSARSTLSKMAETILDQAPPRFALAGHSMGGIIALEMMDLAPERISRLALMDTNFLAESPAAAAGRDVQIASAKAGQLKRVLSDELGPKYLGEGPERGTILRALIEMGLALGPDVFAAQSEALRRRRDLGHVLDQIRVPTLVLCGEGDRLCPMSRHELMAARIPNAKLEIIAGAEHFPMLEQPEATTAALQRWLTDALVLS